MRGKAARPQSAGPAGQPGPPERRGAAGGEAAGPAGSGRTWLEQLPYWILLCGTGLGLLAMRQGGQNARDGTLEIAGVLLAAAAARLMLPDRRAGMLRSRRRLPDVAAFAALGTSMLVVGLFLPVPA